MTGTVCITRSIYQIDHFGTNGPSVDPIAHYLALDRRNRNILVVRTVRHSFTGMSYHSFGVMAKDQVGQR
jgi:hypothetical protein